jgi:hypothetical protein
MLTGMLTDVIQITTPITLNFAQTNKAAVAEHSTINK